MSDFIGPHHIGLGLPLTLAQEQFSKAFILSIASLAGCGAAVPEPDIDSIDWTLSCRLPRRPKLDLQVKSIRAAPGDGEHVPIHSSARTMTISACRSSWRPGSWFSS